MQRWRYTTLTDMAVACHAWSLNRVAKDVYGEASKQGNWAVFDRRRSAESLTRMERPESHGRPSDQESVAQPIGIRRKRRRIPLVMPSLVGGRPCGRLSRRGGGCASGSLSDRSRCGSPSPCRSRRPRDRLGASPYRGLPARGGSCCGGSRFSLPGPR